jgi:uncharacterized membrane protein
MAENNPRGWHSYAAIKRHPLHPMLVPFPIAALGGTVATDVAFKATGNPFWAEASIWMIGAGLVTAVLAAVVGLVDFTLIKAARSNVGWTHALGNLGAVLLAALSLALRVSDPQLVVTNGELGLSVVVLLVLLVTGWLGGELVFRHKIAQADGLDSPVVESPAVERGEERSFVGRHTSEPARR